MNQKATSKYAIEDDVPLTTDRTALRLGRLPIDELEVGQSFLIPFVTRKRGEKDVEVPETGVNIKAANTKYAPKKFRKLREAGGIRIGRIE